MARTKRFHWTAEQIEALEESIAHWERMKADIRCGENPSTDYCACCSLGWGAARCSTKCPIRAYAGRGWCARTPYERAAELWSEYRAGASVEDQWRAAAQKEIDFLKTVLAAGVPKKARKDN